MDKMKLYDEIKESESKFAFKELLGLEFFEDYKNRYKWQKDQGVINPYRSYLALLGNIDEINIYNKQHAKKFIKDFKTAGKDSNNAESIFSEIIVYRYYIRMVYEGLIKSIIIVNKECDLILERLDGSKVYYELFCVTPKREVPDSDNIIVRDIKSHTQEALSSIRQKLLNKMRKQKQMLKDRENYAVIELNDGLLTGDFTILSSMSNGYKIWFDQDSGKKVIEGYDWSGMVFDDHITKNLKGIIYFNLGNYEARKYIKNPNYRKSYTEPDHADDTLTHVADG